MKTLAGHLLSLCPAGEIWHADKRIVQRTQLADGSGVAMVELVRLFPSATSGDLAGAEEEEELTSLRVAEIDALTASAARRTSSRRKTEQTAAPAVAPRVNARTLARSAMVGWISVHRTRCGERGIEADGEEDGYDREGGAGCFK